MAGKPVAFARTVLPVNAVIAASSAAGSASSRSWPTSVGGVVTVGVITTSAFA